MNKRVIDDYLQDMLDSIAAIEAFIEGISIDDFKHDRKTIFAVTRAIEIIGESVKNIPEPFRSKYPDVPWRAMAGMRDKLIHRKNTGLWKPSVFRPRRKQDAVNAGFSNGGNLRNEPAPLVAVKYAIINTDTLTFNLG